MLLYYEVPAPQDMHTLHLQRSTAAHSYGLRIHFSPVAPVNVHLPSNSSRSLPVPQYVCKYLKEYSMFTSIPDVVQVWRSRSRLSRWRAA